MAKNNYVLKLADFDVSLERGFLPDPDPLVRITDGKTGIKNIWFERWDETAENLPKELAAETVRHALDKLSRDYVARGWCDDDISRRMDTRMAEAAMRTLSFLGHAWVWGAPGEAPIDRIPTGIAVPWSQIAKKLGRPPVLSYASYALNNWRRINPKGPIALGNIALIQNFLGGLDEEWFILPHIEIEAKAGIILSATLKSQHASRTDSLADMVKCLTAISSRSKDIYATLSRMPEHCDPYIYYNRVRPYIHGWKNNPALPDGVIYEEVKRFRGRPQKFSVETGAQSTVIPVLDAALGIEHENDALRVYLKEMRTYMPPKHRKLLEAIEQGPHIRSYVMNRTKASSLLRDAYNDCIEWVEKFRAKHLDHARAYINKQAERSRANPTSVGTGGTPFIPYLEKHRDETKKHLIK